MITCERCRDEVAALVPGTDGRHLGRRARRRSRAPGHDRVERLLARVGLRRSDPWWWLVRPRRCAPPGCRHHRASLLFVVVAAGFADDGRTAAVPARGSADPGGRCRDGVRPLVRPVLRDGGRRAVRHGPDGPASHRLRAASPRSRSSSSPACLLPGSPLVAVAWLLPAAGFIAVVLTASNWVDPTLRRDRRRRRLGRQRPRLPPGTATRWTSSHPPPWPLYAVVLVVAVLVLLQRLLSSTPSWRLR